MILSRLAAVFQKEVLDGVRDRRSMLTALLYPLMAPLTLGMLFSQLAQVEGTEAPPLSIPVIGAENAPTLVDYLRQHDVTIEPAPEDPEAAVLSGKEAVILRIPIDFKERFNAGKPAIVEVIEDGSRVEQVASVRRLKGVLGGWSGSIGAARLAARGVAPDLGRVLDVDDVDLSTPKTQAGRLLEMVQMLVLFAAFICNVYVAIDTTAGERERRSMESLLINPVPRWAIVVGKWLATCLFGAAGVALTILATGVAVAFAPMEKIGLSIQANVPLGVDLFLTVLPVVFLAGSFQILVTSFARSFKEAQTWVSFSSLLATLPGMVLMLHPFGKEPWMTCVPVLAQELIMGAIMRGDPVTGLDVGTSLVSSAALTAVFLAMTVGLFKREGITAR